MNKEARNEVNSYLNDSGLHPLGGSTPRSEMQIEAALVQNMIRDFPAQESILEAPMSYSEDTRGKMADRFAAAIALAGTDYLDEGSREEGRDYLVASSPVVTKEGNIIPQPLRHLHRAILDSLSHATDETRDPINGVAEDIELAMMAMVDPNGPRASEDYQLVDSIIDEQRRLAGLPVFSGKILTID